jgi:anti-sigma regulatory factor (Ser/Thr protein kinase)
MTADTASIVTCPPGDEVTAAAVTCAAVPELRVLEFVVLRAAADQVAVARKLTEKATTGHAACDVAVWLVSEMVSNAVAHSTSLFVTLVISDRNNGDLRVSVSDQGRAGLPRLITGGLLQEHGRGVRLVAHFAKRWGITRGSGTTIWFELNESALHKWFNVLMSADELQPMEDVPCLS